MEEKEMQRWERELREWATARKTNTGATPEWFVLAARNLIARGLLRPVEDEPAEIALADCNVGGKPVECPSGFREWWAREGWASGTQEYMQRCISHLIDCGVLVPVEADPAERPSEVRPVPGPAIRKLCERLDAAEAELARLSDRLTRMAKASLS